VLPTEKEMAEFKGGQDMCEGTLLAELVELRSALAGLVWAISMRLLPHARGMWYCPICRAEGKSLTDLEQGVGHKETCEYAEARTLLNNLKRGLR